jgi:hypothetical protein
MFDLLTTSDDIKLIRRALSYYASDLNRTGQLSAAEEVWTLYHQLEEYENY